MFDWKMLAITFAVTAAGTAAAVYVPIPEVRAACVAVALAGAAALRSYVLAWQSKPESVPATKRSGPPLPLLVLTGIPVASMLFSLAMAAVGCGWLEQHPKAPEHVTDAVLCVLTSASDDPAELVRECGDSVLPIIADLLSTKRAAAKAGFRLHRRSPDAGPVTLLWEPWDDEGETAYAMVMQ